MNNSLFNIKQSSFLNRYFEEAFKHYSSEQLSVYLDLDIKFVSLLENILIKKTVEPEDITISYIHFLYSEGFNFQEIGEIKKITKMGARYHVHNMLSSKDFHALKFDNKDKRSALKNKIFRFEIINNLTDENYHQIRSNLGFSESYFKVFLSNVERG